MRYDLFLITAVLPGIIDAFIRWRFLCRTLVPKYSPVATYFFLLSFNIIYGQINLAFSIANTITGNMTYYCMGYFFLYLLIFRGNLLDKVFLLVFLECSFSSFAYAFLPFEYILFGSVHIPVLIITYIRMMLSCLLFEYVGHRLQNLQHQLPKGLTVYLLFITIFVFISNVIVVDLLIRASNYFTYLPVAIFTVIFSVLGTLVIIFAVFTIDKSISDRISSQGYAMQLAYLKEKEEYWRQLAGFKHDVKNHMICLEGLLRDDKFKQASLYLENLTRSLNALEHRISTGNEFVDAIVNEKAALMESEGIAFTEGVCLPEKCQIEPIDLCCILSNTLDNAIEACELIHDKDKWITARSFVSQSQLVIVIENSISDEVGKSTDSASRNRESRGIGLVNVRNVVEKYGGAMDVSSAETFSFSAMLPLVF